MRLYFGEDAQVAEWVASRIPWLGSGWDFGACVAIGVISDEGEPVGGVVYHGYSPQFRSFEWSAASTSPRWLTPRIVDALLYYPFGQCGCRRLSAAIPAHKAAAKPARVLHRKLGFKREGTVRKGFGNEDAALYGLLASEWKTSKFNLRKEVIGGQEIRAESAASA